MLKKHLQWSIFGAVIGAWVVYWCWANWAFDDWAVRGQFGDQFGALTALFSGLAFAAIVITMNYQRRDLELQMEELAKSTKALAEQAKMQRAQSYCGLAQLRASQAEAQFTLSAMEGEADRGTKDHMIKALTVQLATITREADRLEELLRVADEDAISKTP